MKSLGCTEVTRFLGTGPEYTQVPRYGKTGSCRDSYVSSVDLRTRYLGIRTKCGYPAPWTAVVAIYAVCYRLLVGIVAPCTRITAVRFQKNRLWYENFVTSRCRRRYIFYYSRTAPVQPCMLHHALHFERAKIQGFSRQPRARARSHYSTCAEI